MKPLGFFLGAALVVAQPAFEVASVKLKSPQTRFINTLLTYPGGRITCGGCNFQYLMMEAFDIQPFQISGFPDWARDERYDIEAKPPASSKSSRANPPYAKAPPNEEQRQMLVALLVERFRLQYHRESKPGPVYRLVRTDKKLKLEEPEDKNDFPWVGAPQGGAIGYNGIAGKNISMPLMAFRLSRYLERPVLDQTGLEGSFDFKYQYQPEEGERDVVSSILMSVQQIGLKLEAGKGPVETIVIDRVEKLAAN